MIRSYKTLERPGWRWHIHGWFCMLGCYVLMMYDTTVTGWMDSYFGKFSISRDHRSRCFATSTSGVRAVPIRATVSSAGIETGLVCGQIWRK